MSTTTVASPNTSSIKENWKRQLEPAFYIAPAFLVLIVILIYPLGYSFWLSFHKWTLRDFIYGVPWVGFDNFITLFSSPEFINSLKVTVLFVFFALVIEFTLGMGLALLLNRDLKFKGIIRSLILLPMMCTNVVIGLTWRLLFNYNFGIINYYISQVRLGPVEWLSNPNIALISIIVVDVWNTTSFVALMLLAGLQSMPDEPFEAAKIDGASNWQTFKYLILPLLRSTILVTLLWRLIDAFRIFDVVYLLTAGGPAHATETISMYVYNYGFKSFNLGFASAASFTMIMILLITGGIMARKIGRQPV
jgi:multiple sugar transport system permease protein